MRIERRRIKEKWGVVARNVCVREDGENRILFFVRKSIFNIRRWWHGVRYVDSKSSFNDKYIERH